MAYHTRFSPVRGPWPVRSFNPAVTANPSTCSAVRAVTLLMFVARPSNEYSPPIRALFVLVVFHWPTAASAVIPVPVPVTFPVL